MAKTPSDHRLTLANKLRISRRQLGLSQREFGEKIGLTDKAVSAYEVGRSGPNLDILRLISKMTNKPITYFIDERNSSNVQIQMRLKTIEDEFKAIRKILEKDFPTEE